MILLKKICIIGGDSRLIKVKNELEKKGYFVETLGLFERDSGNIQNSDILILPIPTTRDNLTVFAPLTNRKILLGDIEKLAKEKKVLGCNCKLNIPNYTDYGALDSFAILNAVPTAEGAIKLAIENTPFTLFESEILVIGYGRVGKVLAERLKSLGANVCVSARKQKDFATLKTLGFNYINTNELNFGLLSYNIIFNTVDFEVLNKDSLEKTTATLLVDLSSKGGFDLEFAKSKGITAIKAPSLPAIYSPETAGKILADTVLSLI